MTGMASPMRLEQPLPIVRGSDGRFREYRQDVPAEPSDEVAQGSQPSQWAPFVGQGAAPMTSGVRPYGSAVKPSKPFR
jgi:hypothetical protein